MGAVHFSDRCEWMWPTSDKLDRLYKYMTTPVERSDVELAWKMVQPKLKAKQVCVQAGGCVGVWPYRLAQEFATVYTFEPDPVLFRCLVHNIMDIPPGAVVALNAALGNDNRMVGMRDGDPGNPGGWYVSPGNGATIPSMRIDDLELPACDLIYLDIEGRELDALRGANETIAKYRPVVGLEEKGLNTRFSALLASDWLIQAHGYRVLGKPYSLDVVLVG